MINKRERITIKNVSLLCYLSTNFCGKQKHNICLSAVSLLIVSSKKILPVDLEYLHQMIQMPV